MKILLTALLTLVGCVFNGSYNKGDVIDTPSGAATVTTKMRRPLQYFYVIEVNDRKLSWLVLENEDGTFDVLAKPIDYHE